MPTLEKLSPQDIAIEKAIRNMELTRQEWEEVRNWKEAFQAREEKRKEEGAPLLDELGLSSRTFNAWRRKQVWTVGGVEEMIERGWEPNYQFGEKARIETHEKLAQWKSEHTKVDSQ